MNRRPNFLTTPLLAGRSDVPFASQVALDLRYLDTRGLSVYVRLILLTIKAVLTRRGAY